MYRCGPPRPDSDRRIELIAVLALGCADSGDRSSSSIVRLGHATDFQLLIHQNRSVALRSGRDGGGGGPYRGCRAGCDRQRTAVPQRCKWDAPQTTHASQASAAQNTANAVRSKRKQAGKHIADTSSAATCAFGPRRWRPPHNHKGPAKMPDDEIWGDCPMESPRAGNDDVFSKCLGNLIRFTGEDWSKPWVTSDGDPGFWSDLP